MANQELPQRFRSQGLTLAKLLAAWLVCGILTYLALDWAELLGPHAGTPFAEGANEEAAPREGPVATSDAPPADESVASAGSPSSGSQWPELDAAQAPLPFPESAFQMVPGRLSGLTEKELKRWLAPISGADGRFFSEVRDDTSVAGFEGLVQLRPPWPEFGVLRFSPFAHEDGLAVHFWQGDRGVSLYCYNEPRPAWAAYRTTRPRDRMRPSTHVLLATDDGRFERAGAGVVEIRHQEGTLVLSRGDLRLLTIPFELPPTEVLFAHRTLLSELVMFRSLPLPEEPELSTTDLFPSPSPAGLPWKAELPEGAELTRAPEGAIQLSRGKETGAVVAHVPLPRTGLYEAIVEFDEVAPGTGIYLGNDAGQPRHVFGFRRDRTTGQPVLGIFEPGATRFEADENVVAGPVAFGGRGQWLRIVAGCGTVRASVSGDGRHWGRVLEPQRQTQEACTHLGLIASATPMATKIGLRTVRVRELTGVTALADADLRERVPADLLQTPRSFLPWCAAVLASQPPDVDARGWRKTCAVRTLTEGRSREASNRILTGLLQDSLDREAPPQEKLRVLDQAALAFDAWEPEEADQLFLCYDRIGRELADRGQPQPFVLTARALLEGAIWCSAPFQTFPEHLLRAELLELAARNQWSAALELCARLQFWNATSDPIATWPEHRSQVRELVGLAERLGGEATGAQPHTGDGPSLGEHPVVTRDEQIDRTALTELQTALVNEHYEEASGKLSEIRSDRLGRWLADPADPDLYRSLPYLLLETVERHPEWRGVMTARHGAAAEARVEQAISEGRVTDVEAAVLQFFGTPAAVSACRWLGDRAFAEGKLVLALTHYRRAQAMADPAQTDELALRAEIARGLLGQRGGAALARSVTVEQGAISAADLQRLRSALPADRPVTASETKPPGAANRIEPAALSARERHDWPGATAPPPPGVDPRAIDWGARQLACVQSGDLLIASNRRQVAGYDLKSGKRSWIRVFDAVLASHAWPLLALRPAIGGDLVYLRRPRRTGLGLVAVSITDGRIVWESESKQVACSDPLLIHDRLYCFTITVESDARSRRLDLTVFDPQTGRIDSQAAVLGLLASADRVPSCEAVVVEDRIVGSVAGAVVCCDLAGKPLWLRRQTYFPMAAGAFAGVQEYSLPIVSGTHVIVLQPGVLELCCLESESGRPVWHVPLPNARRLLGADAAQIYVETTTDIRALALEDGRLAWRRPVQRMLDACHLGDDDLLLYTRRDPVEGRGYRPLMVWLDTRTGRETALWPLSELKDGYPVLGPLVRHGRGAWSFFGRGPNGTPRSLWQLTRTSGSAFPAYADHLAIDRWTSGAEAATAQPPQTSAVRLLPQWTQFGGIDDPASGHRPQIHGKSEVLATRAGPDLPAIFTREVRIGAEGRPRLVVTAGHESSEAWKLRVDAGGRNLLSETVDGSAVRDHWKTWQIDLQAFAGQTIQIVVEQQAPQKDAWGFWKQLEVVP